MASGLGHDGQLSRLNPSWRKHSAEKGEMGGRINLPCLSHAARTLYALQVLDMFMNGWINTDTLSFYRKVQHSCVKNIKICFLKILAMDMKNFLIISGSLFLSACVTTGGTNNIPSLTYTEATAFEKGLLSSYKAAPSSNEFETIQPKNKDIPCLIATTKDQLSRKNFRAYWDGDCKNGYAYGLGRDIAISDTHHNQEITIYNGDDTLNQGNPRSSYDFLENHNFKGIYNTDHLDSGGFSEHYKTSQNGFNVINSIDFIDSKGNHFKTEASPFHPVKIYAAYDGPISYRIIDFTNLPKTSDQAEKIFETANSKTNIAGGFRIVQYKNGLVQHQKLDESGQFAGLVQLPNEYIEHFLSKTSIIKSKIANAIENYNKADRMEREYKFMACNGKYRISGVDEDISSKICTWKDEFKDDYNKALSIAKQNIQNASSQADINERKLQEQREYQQKLAQQKKSEDAIAWQNLTNQLNIISSNLNQHAQQINNQNQIMMQNNMPNLVPRQGGAITCINTGSVTSCR